MNNKLLGVILLITIVMAGTGLGFGQSPLKLVVDKVGWFGLQSQELVEPGMNDVPLVLNFVAESVSTVYNLNVSVDLPKDGYFNYSYVSGGEGGGKQYFVFPEVSPAENFTIVQMLNISHSTPTGIYQFHLNYSYSISGSNYTGDSPFDVPVLGYANPVVADAYFGEGNHTILATSYMNNVPFTIMLENMGNSPAFNLSVSFVPSYPLSGFAQKIPLSAIPAYSTVPITFVANIGQANQRINQNLTVIFNNGEMKNITFSLILAGYPKIMISQAFINSGNIEPSQGLDGVPLVVYLEDESEVPAINVTARFTPSYPLGGYSQTVNIPAIPSYQPIPVNFIVNISGPGENVSEILNIFYNDSWHTIDFNIIISGSPSMRLVSYFTDPPWLYEDEQFILLKVFFANSGNGIANNFSVVPESPYFSISSAHFNFPKVLPGQILNLTFILSVSNETGYLPVFLNTSYGSFIMHLRVNPLPSLNLTYNIPTIFPGSSKNLFIFKLSNTGNDTIYDLNIHILTPDVFYIDVPSSNQLGFLTANNITFGSLSPGQSIIITFLIDVRSTTAIGEYPSQLFVSYRMNNSPYQFFKVFNFLVNVNYTGIQKITSGYYLPEIIVAIAIILIVIFSIVIVRRRRSRKNGEIKK